MGDPNAWMWSDALALVARADRLHRQMFQPSPARTRPASWEPPVDVLETSEEVLVIAALPGVREADIHLAIDGSDLLMSGERSSLSEFGQTIIHRLELPQGRFERRVPLPAGVYDQIRRGVANGCLMVSLRKRG